MPANDLGRLVRDSLDRVLVPAGFQGGQSGDDGEGNVQVVFCASHDEFSRRFPRLPQANRQAQGGTCVDLVIDVWSDGTLGRLDLEGTSVDETLRDAGMVAESEAVAPLVGRPAAEALPTIEDVLGRMLGSRD
jgi:hypothetical protein